ncbi:uncharacterized protein MYCFIDRAFT_194951 [Pseudocercospora fijiensis CIRAD86]|uniref:Peptidase A1 domain-containing protein n=1 Tax=Pseudocercospora fijiensis (strain CIRAD86) TaxID=383855 RepID=M3BCS2_PSEFD|nr:uncharacterized protein MYCFIDRAFT_194951 [Pseudocercospora fijiensis CIRAD86]EME87077.1 hypothetical protein MYCFIDRAFT_194951 [Pseudocercospora fijiensis CIRAD86]
MVGPIGTPPQLVNLLPATSVSAIWPTDFQGCIISSDPNVISDPVNCPELRGGLFSSASVTDSSFQAVSASNGDGYFSLPFSSSQQSQGYNGTAIVGTDTIVLTLKSGTPKLSGQTIASNLATLPYLGMFGLTGYASHVNSTSEADMTKAPLQALKDGGTISAYSYGYTAGRHYTPVPELLSLTFGGYDANRGAVTEDSAISATFNSDWQRDLVVIIKGITIDGAPVEGLDDGIPNVFIDSLIPEIWLPESTCQAFERAFNLVWNETFQYYLVNDSQHDQMLKDGKTVTFTLAGNRTAGAPTVDIEMPYGAFDQALQYPLANIEDGSTSYRYFPLKRASGSDQYTLGRTFLQEAYLTADYGNSKFFLSKAKPLDGAATDLRCIGCKKSGLSTGAIAGIAVAAAAVVLMIAAFFFWRWKKKRDIRKLRAELQLTSRNSIGGTTIQEDDPSNNFEFFKPTIPAEEEVKPELDGSSAIPAGFVHNPVYRKAPSRR